MFICFQEYSPLEGTTGTVFSKHVNMKGWHAADNTEDMGQSLSSGVSIVG